MMDHDELKLATILKKGGLMEVIRDLDELVRIMKLPVERFTENSKLSGITHVLFIE